MDTTKMDKFRYLITGVVLTVLCISLTANYFAWQLLEVKPYNQSRVVQYKTDKPERLSMADLE